LSHFLRNEKTQPPLTVAITGEWGSGKSSLMNLLRADLERHGWRPVRFNAWHHQKEKHLLASLLAAIRRQAIPPLWTFAGLAYRANLLRIRWGRYRVPMFLLLLFLAFATGLVLSDPQRLTRTAGALDALQGQMKEVGRSKKATEKTTPTLRTAVSLPVPASPPRSSAAQLVLAPSPSVPSKTSNSSLFSLTPLLALISGFAILLIALRKLLTSFGARPAQLLSRLFRSSRLRDLEALTGFRDRFAAEFKDVTEALKPRTMVVVIDDLDRCRPDQVLDLLEAVNFLVRSGDCFIVLGADRDRVLRSVGLGFKDLAYALVDPPPRGAQSDDDAAELTLKRQRDFAQQYLEKLINLEIPVPAPTREQSQLLLKAAAAITTLPPSPIKDLATRLRQRLALIATLGLLGLSLWCGYRRPVSPVPSASEQTPTAATATVPPVTTAAPLGGIQAPPAPQRPPVEYHSGEHQFGWPLIVFLLLGLAAGVALSLLLRSSLVTRDSPAFERALATWHPLLFAKHNTPRALKRYVNRVRYLAMLQRPRGEEATWLHRLAILRRPPATTTMTTTPLPEEVLVALSAI